MPHGYGSDLGVTRSQMAALLFGFGMNRGWRSY